MRKESCIGRTHSNWKLIFTPTNDRDNRDSQRLLQLRSVKTMDVTSNYFYEYDYSLITSRLALKSKRWCQHWDINIETVKLILGTCYSVPKQWWKTWPAVILACIPRFVTTSANSLRNNFVIDFCRLIITIDKSVCLRCSVEIRHRSTDDMSWHTFNDITCHHKRLPTCFLMFRANSPSYYTSWFINSENCTMSLCQKSIMNVYKFNVPNIVVWSMMYRSLVC